MRRVLLLCAALALAATAQAAGPLKPTEKQRKALCDRCAVVTEVRTEKRKGEATAVGTVGGAVVGGVVGNQVGDSGVATVGGAVVGGLLGREIEKQVKKHTVWVVRSTRRDGTTQRHEFTQDPKLQAGDTVQADGSGLKKR